MDEQLTKILYEKLLIQYIFNDEIVRDKILPYLTSNIFTNSLNSQLVQYILNFQEKYEKFPKINELKLFIKSNEIYEHLVDVMNIDSSDYDRDFILGELEEFFKKSLVYSIQLSFIENMKKDSSNLQAYPDELREALSFTFDNSIGMSLLDDSEKIYEKIHDKDEVLKTGIKHLDYYFDGGFHKKTLNMILAQSGGGKSTFMCGLAVNYILSNKKVLMISLEMAEIKVMDRILANLFDIEVKMLKQLSKNEFDSKYASIRNVLKSDFKVLQKSAKTVSSNKIRSILKDYEMKQNFKPDILILDYAGLMITNKENKNDNTYSEMKKISEELRSIATDNDLVIITANQVNRSGFNTTELSLTSIADSIGVISTCDTVLGLTTSDELKYANRSKITILKNRYGLQDISMFIGLDFSKMTIYNLDESDPEVLSPKPKSVVDEAAVEVLKTMQSNVNEKRKKITGIE